MIKGQGNNKLNTKLLPKYNCSNCKHFCKGTQNIFSSDENGSYAMECLNLIHPLEDCILRGFEAHSDQSTFSQTLNKK